MVAGASLAFPPPLSFTSSLPPHNNPFAVLMVTLSARSEGLDFYRTHELRPVPAVDTLPLSSCTSIFFSVSIECFISSSLLAQDPFVSFCCLHLSSAHLSSLLVESTVPSLPAPGFCFIIYIFQP